MNPTPTISDALDTAQYDLLSKLLNTLSHEQKIWLGGYLSGLNQSTNQLFKLLDQQHPLPGSSNKLSQVPALKILYGTRSGNAQKLAQKAQKKAEAIGIPVELVNLNEYNPKQIKQEKNLLIVVSTDGEGAPPLSAEEFYQFLHSKKAPELNSLKYSVLALGDSSYTHFCKTGRDIDSRLEQLGGTRFFDRIDCDLDFEEAAQQWIEASIKKYATENLPAELEGITLNSRQVLISEANFNKEKPFQATVLTKQLVTGLGSGKEVYHYEISLEDSGLKYTPGDSLGVYSSNHPEMVDLVLRHSKLNEQEKIQIGDKEKTIREALTHHYELTRLTPPLVKAWAVLAESEKLHSFLQDSKKLEEFTWGRDVLDLFELFPIQFDAKTLLSTLRKLQPRLYSIASSQKSNPDEVHITVSAVKYQYNQRNRFGVCSTYLSDQIQEDSLLPIYIDENISFRLPKDPSVPIVMIGAGTGVAPFRAFMQERALNASGGKNWLFFGDRNFATDFLYQTEWQKWHLQKQLNRIDLAFSRDQAEKVYVQHKILKQSKEFYKWIQDGAHIYICGDKNSMARDVKQSILQVIESEGGLKSEKAEAYFNQLRKENRLQEDVY
ncbi:MAG: assimilatory sulfite reductase (NADPH) flavoprotein subunit [Bacteroidota bacterium]|nr:MAG: assimilatory sulfite reductase (NADPH) flavoprotein subunit [Bacteroidota bacterium]